MNSLLLSDDPVGKVNLVGRYKGCFWVKLSLGAVAKLAVAERLAREIRDFAPCPSSRNTIPP